MLAEYVRILTPDALELQGLYCPSSAPSRSAVLHMHGLAGNFYENQFIDALSREVLQRGWHFLTVNNRGHDYISDLLRKTDDGWVWERFGAAHECFQESVRDIQGWLAFLTERGVERVVLEGHSSGATKVAYFAGHDTDRRLAGLIMLSPSDDVGAQKMTLGNRFSDVLRDAQALVKQGRENELMPADIFEYPISARTYLNMFSPGTPNGLFETSNPATACPTEVARISCPVLAVSGDQDETPAGDIRGFLQKLKDQATGTARFDIRIVEGAGHSFLGYEQMLASLVGEWLREV